MTEDVFHDIYDVRIDGIYDTRIDSGLPVIWATVYKLI
jgi:hypothetical protein